MFILTFCRPAHSSPSPPHTDHKNHVMIYSSHVHDCTRFVQARSVGEGDDQFLSVIFPGVPFSCNCLKITPAWGFRKNLQGSPFLIFKRLLGKVDVALIPRHLCVCTPNGRKSLLMYLKIFHNHLSCYFFEKIYIISKSHFFKLPRFKSLQKRYLF